MVSITVTSSTSSSLSLTSTAISVSAASVPVSTVSTEVTAVEAAEVVIEEGTVLTTAGWEAGEEVVTGADGITTWGRLDTEPIAAICGPMSPGMIMPGTP